MTVPKEHKREYRSPANRHRYEHRTAGERIADRVTASFGSWSFIVGQSVIVLPLLLSQNRQAGRDRIEAGHAFRVDQLALQYLFAWHRDAHGPGCDCVQQLGPAVDEVLARLADDVSRQEDPDGDRLTVGMLPVDEGFRS